MNIFARRTISSFPMGLKRSSIIFNLQTPVLPANKLICRTYVHRGASNRPKVAEKPKPRPAATATETPEQQAYNVPANTYEAQQSAATYTPNEYGMYSTAGEYVNSSVSLQAFLKRSMVTTAVGIGISAAAAAVFINTPIVLAHPYISLGCGVVGSIGGIIGLQYFQPKFHVDKDGIVQCENSTERKGVFGLMLVSQGLALAPALGQVAMVTPTAIPVAAALSVATMAGMGAYALKQPAGSLQKYGPALYVGLFGLIGTSLLNMFIQSSTLSLVNSGIGILLFSGMTAYDTHIAIEEHNAGRPDHLSTAANFYLNFVNLFISYLRIIREFMD